MKLKDNQTYIYLSKKYNVDPHNPKTWRVFEISEKYANLYNNNSKNIEKSIENFFSELIILIN